MARQDSDDEEQPVTKLEFVWLMMTLKRIDPVRFNQLCALGWGETAEAISSESEIPN